MSRSVKTFVSASLTSLFNLWILVPKFNPRDKAEDALSTQKELEKMQSEGINKRK
jgi:hypothetical protein